jgi:hypothetical protein
MTMSQMTKSRRIALLLLLAVAALLVVTCASTVGRMTLSDAANLRKGMSAEESKAALPEPPKFEFALEPIGDESSILVHAYNVVSGDYSSEYILAFTDGKLLYWGYPHEFARSRDSLVNAIGEQAVSKLKELEAEELAKQNQEMEKSRKPSH